jgi:hypothetical protein
LIAIEILALLVIPVQGEKFFEIHTAPAYYGIYKGYEYITIATGNTSIMETTLKLVATLSRNDTYLILIYKVPEGWLGRAQMMNKPPLVETELRAEFITCPPAKDRYLRSGARSVGVCEAWT